MPILGTTNSGTVDLSTTGHQLAWLVGSATPLTITLGGGQTLLVNPADPMGELLAQPARLGRLARHDLAVPADPGLAGFELSTQALHSSGVQPLALSNALNLFIGH